MTFQQMTLQQMKEFLVDYANNNPQQQRYIVRRGFKSYFACADGSKLYYKGGDRVILWLLGDTYVQISVNEDKRPFNVKSSAIRSLIVNRLVLVSQLQ